MRPAAAAPEAAGAPPAAGQPALVSPLERVIDHQVAPGIQHRQVIREDAIRPMSAHLLQASLREPGWRLQVWPARDVLITPDASQGREAVGQMAARRGAFAALNGDFFPWTGDPLGLQITDGEIVSEPFAGRSAFGLTRDGRTLWGPVRFEASVSVGGRQFALGGVNRGRRADDLVAYTPRQGATTGTNAAGAEVVVEWLNGGLRAGTDVDGTVSNVLPASGNTPIPAGALVLSGHGTAALFLRRMRIGDGVRLRIHLAGEDGASWDEAWQAIGGGPRLLRRGEVCLTESPEGFRPDVVKGKAPRSAVGVTADGQLLLAAVDGRQLASAGMTLAEWAAWLRAQGAVEAINLDGGGSTTLWMRQVVANSPSEGTQRLVANALLIALDPPPAQTREEIALLPPAGAVADAAGAVVVTAGTHLQFRAARRLPDGTWQDLPEGAVTWSLEKPGSLLAQDGTLLGMRAGAGGVAFSTGTQIARVPVITTAGPPARVTTALEVDPSGTGVVRARVVDVYGNACAGALFRLRFATAAGEHSAEETADGKGEARLPLPLADLAADTAPTVSAGDAPPAVVALPKASASPPAARPAGTGRRGTGGRPARLAGPPPAPTPRARGRKRPGARGAR